MARTKKIDDEAFRVLLKDYQRPSLDPEVLGGIFARADRGRAIAPTPSVRPGRFAWAAIAAGLILASGIGALALLRQGGLAEPYAIVGTGGTGTMDDREGVVEAGDMEVRLRTIAESLLLAPQSRLRLASDPWRRLSGETGNRYILERGSIHIEHSGTGFREGFSLIIPWGTARPLGTALSCRIDEAGADLYCLSGALSFKASKGGEYVVSSGMVLRIRDEGRGFRLEAITGADHPLLPTTATRAIPAPPPSAPSSAATSPTAPSAGTRLPASLDAKPAPALARQWTQGLGAKPLELYADERWAILVFAKEIRVLDLKDGREIARSTTGDAIGAYARSGDRLVLYGKAVLRALSLPGLEEAWSAPTGNLSFTGFTVAEDRLYLPSAEGKLYIHELGDGRLVDAIVVGVGLYGRPLVADGRIIVSSIDKRILAYRESDRAKLWEYKADGRFLDDRPLAIGDRIVDYTQDGSLFALDARTGGLLWKNPPGSTIARPPQAWGGGLVYLDADGAHTLSIEGKVAGLGSERSSDLALCGDGSLLLAGPSGIVKLRAGASERLDAGPAALARGSGGSILSIDDRNRLTFYRLGQ